MKRLAQIKVRYPLYIKLLVFKFTTLILCGVVLFGAYQIISSHLLSSYLKEQRQELKPYLSAVQEQWRTLKYMELNDALASAIEEFKQIHGLDSLAVVEVKQLPKELTAFDVVVPRATDPVINYVVHARLPQTMQGYLKDMQYLLLSILIAMFLAFTGLAIISGRLLFRWHYKPIGQLNDVITSMNTELKLDLDCIKASGEIGDFIKHVRHMVEFIRGYERTAAMGKMAAQIASVVTPYLKIMKKQAAEQGFASESDKRYFQEAVRGLDRIVQDLHEKQRRLEESLDSMGFEKTEVTDNKSGEGFSTLFLFSIIESLVTEKRMQYHTQPNLKIDLVTTRQAFGAFVKVKALTLRKLISGILDAFTENGMHSDHITVKQDANYYKVILTISSGLDTEHDPKSLRRLNLKSPLMTRFDKNEIFQKAQTELQEWGAELLVEQTETENILVTIELLRQPMDTWLLSNIELDRSAVIVVLDEDQSVHQLWDTVFQNAGINIQTVLHFDKPEDFEIWFNSDRKHQQLRTGYDIFLTAYKFVNSEKTGLDLIEEYKLQSRSVLVTSQYKKTKLHKYCKGLGVRILPKSLVPIVPVVVLDMMEKPDCILIAEDEHVQVYWRMEARLKGKNVLTFNNQDSFFQQACHFDRSIPIYVTTQFSSGKRGIDFTLDLNKLGFTNIYIVTGRDRKQFTNMPWVKDIVDKNPPWSYQ